MPHVRMKRAAPVGGRNRARGSLVEVDHRTARALAHLDIAEHEEPQTKYAVVTAEALDEPVLEKRTFKRQKARK